MSILDRIFGRVYKEPKKPSKDVEYVSAGLTSVIRATCPDCGKKQEFNTWKTKDGKEYTICPNSSCNKMLAKDKVIEKGREVLILRPLLYEDKVSIRREREWKILEKEREAQKNEIMELEAAKNTKGLDSDGAKRLVELKKMVRESDELFKKKWDAEMSEHKKRLEILGSVLKVKKDKDGKPKTIGKLKDEDLDDWESGRQREKVKSIDNLIKRGSSYKVISGLLSRGERREYNEKVLEARLEAAKIEKGAEYTPEMEKEIKERAKDEKITETPTPEEKVMKRGPVKKGAAKAIERVSRPGKFFNEVTKYSTKSTFSLILALAGIALGAFLSWPFLVALTAWAARNILPTPGQVKIEEGNEDKRWGSLLSSKENRHSTGLAATRSLLKLVILFFLGWGFFATELPFRGLLLLVFFFTAYFSLPGEYSPSEPYKFMEGIWRPFVAFILAIVVFRGVFLSPELMWLCLAFFAVVPIATEKENLARAIGHAGSGISQTYENVDKIIFIILMVIGAISMGMLPWFGGGGMDLDWGTVFGNIFFPFWIISLIGGVTSPASVRPYTGVIMLAMVFIFYSVGTGEQIVGQGFFGAWWPTVHNTMMSFVEPLGEAFGMIGETFGSTFSLFLDPMGFAKNIMAGTYESSPTTGTVGSYGVEIEDIMVPQIAPGTETLVSFTLKNVGPVNARNVKVSVGLPDYLEGLVMVGKGEAAGTSNVPLNVYDKDIIPELGEMEPGYYIPMFFTVKAENCDDINKKQWLSRLSHRNEYIRINFTVEYDYEVDSWMELEMISNREWQERTARGTLRYEKAISHISTSPARLSIGSFQQPIIAGKRPFYIGFNLTSAEGKNSRIIWERTTVHFDFSKEIVSNFVCSPYPSGGITNFPLSWEGKDIANRAVFCNSLSPTEPAGPSETYRITANATFGFSKWVTKDTQFSFDDVCLDLMKEAADEDCRKLDEEECAASADCEWKTVPGTTEPICLSKQ